MADGDEYWVLGENPGARQHVRALDEDNLVWLEVEDQPAARVVGLALEDHLATWEDLYLVFLLPVGNVELFGTASLSSDRCRDNILFFPLRQPRP